MEFDKKLDLKELNEIRGLLNKKNDYGILSHKIKEDIYHYTTVSSLHSIIENKGFFASQSNFLNDKKELIHIESVLKECIDSFSDRKGLKNFCSEFQKLYKNISWLKNRNYYIISFSRNKDNMALWTNYAQGLGCNIKLHKDDITNLIDGNKTKEFPSLVSVIYDDSEKINIIEKFLMRGYNLYEESINIKGFSNNAIYSSIIFDMSLELSQLALCFKQSEFCQEDEVRMILTNIDTTHFVKATTIDLSQDEIQKKDLFFREKDGALIPYIKVYLNKNFFDSICIGPKNNSDIARLGWEEYLNYKNYEGIIIENSKIPLRY